MHSMRPIPSTSDIKNAVPTCPVQSNGTAHAAVDQGVHAYKCPGAGDLRGVCPALNTLANHSYLPHHGKSITSSTLAEALRAGYGLSSGFAEFLVLGGYYLLRREPCEPLDLHDIAKHDGIAQDGKKHHGIEHNASVVHDDAHGAPFAPSAVDPILLHKFLNKAYSPLNFNATEGPDVITIEDIAHTRVAREAESDPIDAVHAEIARGEFAMVLGIFGKGPEKTLIKEEMNLWLNENRFPDGWAPSHTETLSDTKAESTKLRNLMKAYRATEKEDASDGVWSFIEKVERLIHDGRLAQIKSIEELVHKFETAVHPHNPDFSKAELARDEKLSVDVATEVEAPRVPVRV